MPVSADQIAQALQQRLGPDAQIEVINESHLHAGHAGAGEGSHWRVRVGAAALAGLGRVAQHRLVYDALASLIPQGIHALAIEIRAPQGAA